MIAMLRICVHSLRATTSTNGLSHNRTKELKFCKVPKVTLEEEMTVAQQEFRIFKVPDQELLDSIVKIVQSCGIGNVQIHGNLAKSGGQEISLDSANIENHQDKDIEEIFSAQSTLFYRVRTNFDDVRLDVLREESSDKAQVTFSDDTVKGSNTIRIISAIHKHLRTYARTESTDRLLGDELAEFYRKRESALLKLEDLAQRLFHENEEYRRKVEEESQALRERWRSELHTEYEGKNREIKSREEELAQKMQELDDRSSRHARRQLRNDLKQILAARNQNFSLTRKTSQKRIFTHAIFLGLIGLFGALVMGWIPEPLFDSSVSTQTVAWISIVRRSLGIVALAFTAIYYIRWNDQWFHQIADEEFRLKRLELDIDRASWVVEMALEWKEEKGTEIPTDLINRLSQNLFSDTEGSRIAHHPNEDIMSALLGASTELNVKIPVLGEAKLDRRGIQRFQNEVKKVEDAKK